MEKAIPNCLCPSEKCTSLYPKLYPEKNISNEKFCQNKKKLLSTYKSEQSES